MRHRGRSWWLLFPVLVALVAAACGSESMPKGATARGTVVQAPTRRSYTLGLLTDESGLGASSDGTAVQGVRAAVKMFDAEGYDLRLDVADTTTTPAGALSAAQALVEQDHVFAVVAESALTFAAAPFLAAHRVPVIGSGQDGTEWLTDSNMFSEFGREDASKVSTTDGKFMRQEGVTTVGTLGYGISALSAEAAKAYAASGRAVGLAVGYQNSHFPFGSTNVQPVALAMKNAGVNGFTATVTPGTGLALVTALEQLGVDVKVALLPTGYGGDLVQAGPGALHRAQGVYFQLIFEPVEMRTAATERLQGALRGVGVTGDPTFAEYLGYVAVDLFVRGVANAGGDPTPASLITGLGSIHAYDAAGLLGTHTVDLAPQVSYVDGPGSCAWMTRLVGSRFELVPGADPICGSVVPGVTVSS